MGELRRARLATGQDGARLTAQAKEARLNLVTSLIGGISQGLGGNAPAATLAARIEGENNYLTPSQQQKREQALLLCRTMSCKISVQLKYGATSLKQDTGLAVGAVGGLGIQTKELIEALPGMVQDLPKTLTALTAIVHDPAFIAQVGDALAKQYQARAALLTQAYNAGGWDGAITAGVEGSRFASDMAGLITGVSGVAKGAAVAGKAGLRISTEMLAKPALTMDAASGAKGVGELSFGANGRKLDFLFNRNIDQSNAYNARRAEGNASRIGIADTAANRTEVTRLFNEAYNNPATIIGSGKLPGSNVREFFLPSVTGTGSKIQFVEQGGKIITIMAK